MKLKELLEKVPFNSSIKKLAIYGKDDRLITTPPVEDIPNLLLWESCGSMKDTITPKLFRSKVIKHKVEDEELKISIQYNNKRFEMPYHENDFENHVHKVYFKTYEGKEYIDFDVWAKRKRSTRRLYKEIMRGKKKWATVKNVVKT